MAVRPADPLTPEEQEIVAGLDSAFRPLALAHRARVLARGVPFTFISGFRSRSEQRELYAKQPTGVAAQAGKSKHEIGFAYDAHGPTSPQQWLIYGQEAERIGLEWGGRYAKPDLEHIEAREARDALAQYRAVKLGAALALLATAAYVATTEQ